MRILYIGGSKQLKESFYELTKPEPSTIVDLTPFKEGLPHLEYEFYEHVAVGDILEKVMKAETEGYDAAIIGCFYDPGLREARELVSIPIVGVCEASVHVASMLGHRFSVLVGRRKWIPKMRDNIRIYGVEPKIASWRVLNLTVPEMRDKEVTERAVLREATAAVEQDNAEAVVLGCTGMFGQARRAQEALGVPVLDPVITGLRVAEMLAVLYRKYGIGHSKKFGYEPPPREEFEAILRSAKQHN